MLFDSSVKGGVGGGVGVEGDGEGERKEGDGEREGSRGRTGRGIYGREGKEIWCV